MVGDRDMMTTRVYSTTDVSQYHNVSLLAFTAAKDDGGGGDNWSYKSWKAPVKSSPPTNQHQVFLQDGYPLCRPTNSVKALKGKYHTPWTCSPHAQLGSSDFVFDH